MRPANQEHVPDPAIRWKLDRQRYRRKVSNALDEVCLRLYGAEECARWGIRDRGRRDEPYSSPENGTDRGYGAAA